MLLSIIIPCYNSEKTIRRLLDSLTHQKFKDYEIIIIDDCSMDSTFYIIEEYVRHSDVSIRLDKNQKNSGPGISRNRGIDMATGDYLAFIDSDDDISTDYLESISTEIAKNKSDVIYLGRDLIIGEKHNVSVVIFNEIPTTIALGAGSLCRYIWKRNLWMNIRLPEIKNAEDISVIPILLSRASVISTINKVVYFYIYNPTSLSSTRSKQVFKNFRKSFNFTCLDFPKDKYSTELEFHGIKTLIYGAALNGLMAGISGSEIREMVKDFTARFPDWKNNRYLQERYTPRKRLFVRFVGDNHLILAKLYAKIQELLLKILR